MFSSTDNIHDFSQWMSLQQGSLAFYRPGPLNLWTQWKEPVLAAIDHRAYSLLKYAMWPIVV